MSSDHSNKNASSAANTKRGSAVPTPALLFLLSLTIPFLFNVGPVQMSIYRIFLLLMIVPCLLNWASGGAGRIRVPDILLLLMSAWVALSYWVVHDVNTALEGGGINFIETVGAYLVARRYIRTAEDFRAMTAAMFWIIAIMLPFAIYETATGHNVLLDLASKLNSSVGDIYKRPRWGFDRVQGIFQHPILFGIFCGSAPALVYYVLGYNTSFASRWGKTALTSFAAALSLSSGPLTSLVAQFLLIFWDRALSSVKKRWLILTSAITSLSIAFELAANRSMPEIFITFFAFNTHSAMNRIRIWNFGTISVSNYPFFGVGKNEWERLDWMSASIDMFWLVPAVRNGLPSAIFLHLAFFAIFLSIAFKRDLPKIADRYRTGFLICMVGFYLGGWTVNYWKTVYVLFIFLLGSGVWILDTSRDQADEEIGGPKSGTVPEVTQFRFRRKKLLPRYTRYTLNDGCEET